MLPSFAGLINFSDWFRNLARSSVHNYLKTWISVHAAKDLLQFLFLSFSLFFESCQSICAFVAYSWCKAALGAWKWSLCYQHCRGQRGFSVRDKCIVVATLLAKETSLSEYARRLGKETSCSRQVLHEFVHLPLFVPTRAIAWSERLSQSGS